ncbi:MAG: ankyrin repeat domain-containing protein [Alphaproteobacteria bacterium]|nr:ankyrin repeat domain-containing protein [Alphaproteobacteria bacterium]
MTNLKNWDETWGAIDWEKGKPDEIKKQIQDLLDVGVNVNAKDCTGESPLSQAVKANQTEVVEFLIDSGANVNAFCDLDTILMEAAKFSNPEIVMALIEAGADVNAESYWDQQTALMYAVKDNSPEVVEILLGYGADDLAINYDDETPRSLAEERGNQKILDLVVYKGIDEKSFEAKVRQFKKLKENNNDARALKREEIRQIKEKIRKLSKKSAAKWVKKAEELSADLTTTSPERHALAEKLQLMRQKYGCIAKKRAMDNKFIAELRKTVNRGRC